MSGKVFFCILLEYKGLVFVEAADTKIMTNIWFCFIGWVLEFSRKQLPIFLLIGEKLRFLGYEGRPEKPESR